MASNLAAMVESLRTRLLPVFEKYADRVVFAYLFGSAGKGEMTPLSDIDIAVFLSPDRKESYTETKLSLHADLCRLLKRNDIDVIVLNTALNLILLDEIVRYGAVLYEVDTEMREEFEVRVLHQALDFREQRLAVMGA